jgi:carboxypeptidase PM20D1
MRVAYRIAIVVGAAVVGLAAVVSARAFVAGSRQIDVAAATPIAVDAQAAAERLAGAVRLRTISFDDRPDASAEAFVGLHDYLARQFPLVHRTLQLEKVGQYSLLYTWPGSDPSLKPVMLMAHQDVVPIAPGTENDWLHDPFAAEIADGYVWGRGAWDDKSNLLSVLEALEMLVAGGVRPRRTIMLASGHDEEVGGARGARAIAALLTARGVQLEFVVDEGAIITESAGRGIAAPLAMIGVAEKGALTLTLTAEAAPGHSSMPPRTSAIGALATAVERLQNHSMPARIAGVARETFETLAPEMTGFNRLMLANLWLSEPMVRTRLEDQPATAAMLRTTTALTIINGGSKANVLPGRAVATVNFRILPGDTMESVERHVREAIADPAIAIARLGEARDPSPVSPMADGYELINRTIREIFPGTIVAPGLVIAGTDSRHMSALSAGVYRFLPMRSRDGDLARFHGTNERISVANHAELIQFFHRLITVSCIDLR